MVPPGTGVPKLVSASIDRAAESMPKLAYILAASHSGSTLLAMLLGAQSGACTVGELKAFDMGNGDFYRCSCRSLIGDCPFWHLVNAAMCRRGVENFDITSAGTSIFAAESRYVRRLLAPLYRGRVMEAVRDLGLSLSSEWRKLRATSRKRNLTLVESLLEVTGSDVVIDSSKLALRLKYLLQIPELDIRVIWVVRDGRAVSLTYTDEWNFADSSNPSDRGGGNGQRRPPPRPAMAEAAREWRRSNEASEALLSTLPRSQWKRIHYEQLCAETVSTLEELNTFLGLDGNEIRLDFRSVPQHVIGNGMRMDSTSDIRVDERWKVELGSEQLREFDRVAGDLNRKYGYC